MKVLFLDFDGVLNTGSYQNQLRTHGRPGSDGFGELVRPGGCREFEEDSRCRTVCPGCRLVQLEVIRTGPNASYLLGRIAPNRGDSPNLTPKEPRLGTNTPKSGLGVSG